jgi:hypothetical protein
MRRDVDELLSRAPQQVDAFEFACIQFARRNAMATKKWSAKVQTDSTHPDEGLFKQNAAAIAKALASKKVSPKGLTSGMRMLNFYINRAGKTLSKARHSELEKAKELLSKKIAREKAKAPAKKTVSKKAAAKKTTPKKPVKKASVKTSKKAARKRVS